jgi:hypothetical protein
MRKLRTAPPSPNGGVRLREIALYAPRRWDHMSERERAFVRDVHDTLAMRLSFSVKERPDGEWEVESGGYDDSDDEGITRRRLAWWPHNAPGYVTLTLDRGQFRRKSTTGWWTVYVAAYSVREAYHLASLGQWAPDGFTPGIRRMFHDSGTVVLQPDTL